MGGYVFHKSRISGYGGKMNQRILLFIDIENENIDKV